MSNKIAIDQGHVNPTMYYEGTSHAQLNEEPPPYPAAMYPTAPYPDAPYPTGPYPAGPNPAAPYPAGSYPAGPNPAAPNNFYEKPAPYPAANQQGGVAVIVAQPVFNVTPSVVVAPPPRPPSHLALAIFSCLCCNCCCGLAAILKANETSNLYDRGDYQGAEISSREAKKWSMVAIVCGIIVTTVALVLRFTVFTVYSRY